MESGSKEWEEARRRVGEEARRWTVCMVKIGLLNYPHIAFHFTSLPSSLTSICYESRRGQFCLFSG